MTTGISQLARMVGAILAARIIGKTGYGEYVIILSTVGAIGAFAGLGLGVTSTKYVAQWRTVAPERAGRALGLMLVIAFAFGTVAAIALLTFAPQVAEQSLNNPQLASALRISCLLFVFNGVNGVQLGGLYGLEAFRAIAQINLWQALFTFPLMIAGAYFGHVHGLLLATVAVSIMAWMLSQRTLRKAAEEQGIVIRYTGFSAELSILWRFGFPVFLGSILVTPTLWLANTIIVKQPNGYAELGLFGAANQWRNVLMMLAGVISSAALPILSAETGQGDGRAAFKEAMALMQSLLTSIIVPATAALLLLATPIMSLYGPDYRGASLMFVYIVVGTAISVTSGAVGTNVLYADSRAWPALMLRLLWAATYLGFIFTFAKPLGGLALAVGFAFSELISLLARYIYLYKQQVVSPALMKLVLWPTAFIVFGAVLEATVDPPYSTVIGVLYFIVAMLLALFVWFPHGLLKEMLSTVTTKVTAKLAK
ncbi:MAG: oligosaccharide flippase family protein [Caldilineaceae bacterium]|nr:oligosaccharide flippase family protein [Caldilineaceae bacterium]